MPYNPPKRSRWYNPRTENPKKPQRYKNPNEPKKRERNPMSPVGLVIAGVVLAGTVTGFALASRARKMSKKASGSGGTGGGDTGGTGGGGTGGGGTGGGGTGGGGTGGGGGGGGGGSSTLNFTPFAGAAEAQEALVILGFDLGTYGPAGNGVDGDWGNASRQGLRDFITVYNYRLGTDLTVTGTPNTGNMTALSNALDLYTNGDWEVEGEPSGGGGGSTGGETGPETYEGVFYETYTVDGAPVDVEVNWEVVEGDQGGWAYTAAVGTSDQGQTGGGGTGTSKCGAANSLIGDVSSAMTRFAGFSSAFSAAVKSKTGC